MEHTTETKQETPEQIIDRVFKLKQNYELASKDTRETIKDIYNEYMGKMENVKALPYKSQETIPKLRTEVAYIKPYIFSGQPEFEVDGVGDEDKLLSKIIEKILNFRIGQSIPQAYEKIEAWVHQAVTFPVSVIRPIWRFETQKMMEGEKEYEVPVMDAPDLEIPNILDVYYNPIITDIDKQPCIIFRSVLSTEEIKKNPAYTYTDPLGKRNADKVEPGGNRGLDKYNSTAQFNTDLGSAQQRLTEGMVDVYELIDKDRIITIADGKERLILRDVKNPDGFIPAVKFVMEPNAIPNRFDGMCAGTNAMGLGKMYYQMWNQTLDNVKLTNNPMFLFAKGAGIDTRQLVAKPGGGVSVDTTGEPLSNKIQPIVFPDIKQGAIEILTKIEDEHKRATGANDLVQGSASNETLGQDQLAMANVSNRFDIIQRRFKQALADLGTMLIQMEISRLQSPDSEVLRIFPQELRVQIYELLHNNFSDLKFNIKVKGDTTVARNKQLESKRLTELFGMAQGFLTDREKRAMLRRIAERQGENNIDEIIMESNPVMEQQEAMMQQQQQMAHEQQMGIPQGPATEQGMMANDYSAA